jgi:hypothetical protein
MLNEVFILSIVKNLHQYFMILKMLPSSQKLCNPKKILGRTFTKQNLESKDVSRTAGRVRLPSQAKTQQTSKRLGGEKEEWGGREIWYKEKGNGNTGGRGSEKVPSITRVS